MKIDNNKVFPNIAKAVGESQVNNLLKSAAPEQTLVASQKSYPGKGARESVCSCLNEDTTRCTMKIYKPSFWSRVSGAILVLGVIFMSSTWLPNQARADEDDQPQPLDIQGKADDLRQYGWQVRTSKTGNKTTLMATKTDPKTKETTQAKYLIFDDGYYTRDVEHTFKDGRNQPSRVKGFGDCLRREAMRFRISTATRLISSSTTDPSGIKTTKVYSGVVDNRVVQTTKTDPSGNQTIKTFDDQTGKLTGKTDIDGRGTGSTWNYNPQTGGLTSKVTWTANDGGGESIISYDGKSSSCKDVGDTGCAGHVTKTDITDGKTGQEYIRTYDRNGNTTSNQVRDRAGNVTDIKSVGAGTSATNAIQRAT